MTAELFAAYRGEVSVFQPLPNCFEHFGLDFMLDQDLRLWLLEVNPEPDFKQTGHHLESVVARMLEDTITVALDRDLAARGEASPLPTDTATTENMSPLDKAKIRTRGTGFRAIYAEHWQGGALVGDRGMKVY